MQGQKAAAQMTPSVSMQPQHQAMSSNPNPPDKVIFPQFTPNINKDDPRLVHVAESMRQRILNPPPGVQPSELEFEAKLGRVELNEVFKQQVDQLNSSGQTLAKPVARFLDQAYKSTTWDFMPDPKSFQQMPPAYRFTPGLLGFDRDATSANEVTERDAFAWVLHLAEMQCRQNPFFKQLPRIKTKDVIQRNKTRATYQIDPVTKQFSTTPSEVIKKNRISDLNLKSAAMRAQGQQPSFNTDVRFSCSSETKMPVEAAQGDERGMTVREKERTKFDFQWLCLDMTVTRMQTAGRTGFVDNFSYEVELEISKMDYLAGFAGDELGFRSIIRRYMQNAAGLTHVLAYARRKAREAMLHQQVNRQQQLQKEQTLFEDHKKKVQEAFEGYYSIPQSSLTGRAIRPICGDYLAEVALCMTSQKQEEEKGGAATAKERKDQK